MSTYDCRIRVAHQIMFCLLLSLCSNAAAQVPEQSPDGKKKAPSPVNQTPAPSETTPQQVPLVERPSANADSGSPITSTFESPAIITVESIGSTLEDLQKDVHAWQGACRGNLCANWTDASSTITGLQDQASTLKENVLTLQRDRDNASALIENAKKDLAALTSQIANLKKQIQKLQREQEAFESITRQTFVEYECDGDDGKGKSSTRDLKSWTSTCDLTVHWLTSGHQDGNPVLFLAKRVVIIDEKGDTTTKEILKFDIVGTQSSLAVRSDQLADLVKLGHTYRLDVEYESISEPKYPYTRTVLRTKMVQTPFAFQVAAKVYTAWKLNGGDQSYLVPGVAIGLAWRPFENPEDYFALRGVIAAGPNLTPNATIVTDAMGMQEIQNKNGIQVLLGVEGAILRYLSLGIVWVAAGNESSTTPLLLLSYGELYPAIVDTAR